MDDATGSGAVLGNVGLDNVAGNINRITAQTADYSVGNAKCS